MCGPCLLFKGTSCSMLYVAMEQVGRALPRAREKKRKHQQSQLWILICRSLHRCFCYCNNFWLLSTSLILICKTCCRSLELFWIVPSRMVGATRLSKRSARKRRWNGSLQPLLMLLNRPILRLPSLWQLIPKSRPNLNKGLLVLALPNAPMLK